MTEISAARHWASLSAAALAAVIVGFASTILIVMQAADAVGATAAQQASWAAVLCFAMAASSLYLSWHHKMPIITAWSTPGAALIAAGVGGITYAQALGAFAVVGALMIATGLFKPLSQGIAKLPASLAAAMLGGVLLHYVLAVPAAALALPQLIVPLIAVFFVLRSIRPLYAVPVVVALGLALAAWHTGGDSCCAVALTPLVFIWPELQVHALIGLAIPLYLVTMASQNLPGFAVLRAAGYAPPVADCLTVTGLSTLIISPFGGPAVNMAAITASLATGPDAHPDPSQRWRVAIPYFGLYVVVGLLASTIVGVLGSLPKDLVQAIAGLALFSPLMGAVSAMVKDPGEIESASVTFLVTASGFTLLGIGSAFWGLLAGLVLWAAKRRVR